MRLEGGRYLFRGARCPRKGVRGSGSKELHTEAKGEEAEESDGVGAEPPTEFARTRLLLLLLLLLLHC